ncbi:BAG family molecular chaperone regulator 7-like [Phoenix dactylifera]|uniref:BAG family molecular chaperone regulator 7-like n=1 Tax=Phoenix dactylifera TaxID=42345 RepID=A0A8B8Z9L5_PHODC|nr:BAG family molecular chaperone regulator 7-like [Phoenix dactylifera]
MSGFRRFELLDSPCSFLYRESYLWSPTPPFFPPFSSSFAGAAAAAIADEEVERQLGFAADLLNPIPDPLDLPVQCLLPSPAISSFDLFDTAADLIHFRRFQERAETEVQLRSLCDRVTALELGLGRALGSSSSRLDRKYTWTAEIKGAKEEGFDRKYKWVAEAKGGAERNLKWKAEFKGQKEDGFDRKYMWLAEKKGEADRNVKWTAEIKGKGKHAPVAHAYTFKAVEKSAAAEEKGEKKGKKKEKEAAAPRVVEIEDKNPGAIAIRKAFAKSSYKGKKKELSPQDAALIIQVTFRAHLVRRSQVLRCLRDLAVAKGKLKEIRTLFYNFSYRRRIANDEEERQRFSEKIIVLLLTVDAIEGPDYMVRAAKKSMVEELEAMLELVDPQPPGKLGSLKRRRFDLPDCGPIPKELIAGVEVVVQMLEQEDN